MKYTQEIGGVEFTVEADVSGARIVDVDGRTAAFFGVGYQNANGFQEYQVWVSSTWSPKYRLLVDGLCQGYARAMGIHDVNRVLNYKAVQKALKRQGG